MKILMLNVMKNDYEIVAEKCTNKNYLLSSENAKNEVEIIKHIEEKSPDVLIVDVKEIRENYLKNIIKKISYNRENIKIILNPNVDKNSIYEMGADYIYHTPEQTIELEKNLEIIMKTSSKVKNVNKENKFEELEIFEQIFHDSSDGIAVLDANGEVLKVNNSFCEILQIKKENSKNISVKELFKKELSRQQIEKIKEYRSSDRKDISFEIEFDTKFCDCTISRAKSDNIYILNLKDGSKRKNALKLAERSQKISQQIFEGSLSAVFILDVCNNKIIQANSVASKLISLSIPSLLDKNFSELYLDDDPQLEEIVKSITETGSNKFMVSKEIKNFQGKDHHCDLLFSYFKIDDSPLVQVTCLDVSQQLEMEKAFRGSEDQFLLFMDYLPLAVYMKDSKGRLIYTNKYAKDKFLPKDWCGKRTVDIFGVKKCLETQNRDKKLEYGITSHQIEKIKDNTGKNYTISLQKFSFINSLGERNIGGVGLDITGLELAREKVKIMYQVTNSILNIDSSVEFYENVANLISPIIDSSSLSIALYDENEDLLKIVFNRGTQYDFAKLPRKKMLLWEVFDSGESKQYTESEISEMWQHGLLEEEREIGKPWMGVCLKKEDKKIGVIAVQDYGYGEENKLQFLEKIGDEVVLATIHYDYSKRIQKDLEVKDFLIQEVHHRVNNNLQIISSILNLQSELDMSSHCKSLITATGARVKAISLVLSKLYTAESINNINYQSYVLALIRNLMKTYSKKDLGIKIDYDLHDISLDVNLAIPCGLLINEIVGNIFQYSFPDGEGTLRIAMYEEDDFITLNISGNGSGIYCEEKNSGLGIKLIEILTNQLRADVNVDYSKGISYWIKFKKIRLKTFSSGIKII